MLLAMFIIGIGIGLNFGKGVGAGEGAPPPEGAGTVAFNDPDNSGLWALFEDI